MYRETCTETDRDTEGETPDRGIEIGKVTSEYTRVRNIWGGGGAYLTSYMRPYMSVYVRVCPCMSVYVLKWIYRQ